MGDHVFLKVKVNRSFLKLGSCAKLAARFCGPFEILERIGSVAYMIAFPSSMSVHNVFHVSLLKKYIPDANHVIDWNVIQVDQEGTFQVHLVHIFDWKVKQLWNRYIGSHPSEIFFTAVCQLCVRLLAHIRASCARAPKSQCCSMHLRPKARFGLRTGAQCATFYTETHAPVQKNTHCKFFFDLGKAPSLLKSDFMHVVSYTTLSSLFI
jgi:hypothetical protein